MAQIKLKNKTTRHESRRPSPKDIGPSVPTENLRKRKAQGSWFGSNSLRGKIREMEMEMGKTHVTMFAFAESHIKKSLMKCISVLSSTATGWIPVRWRAPERGFQLAIPRRVTLFRSGDHASDGQSSESKISTPTSRFHAPSQELFRERATPVGSRDYHGNLRAFGIVRLPTALH